MINSTAGHEPQFSRDSHRLWSLWDMRDINLSALVELSRELGRIVRHLQTQPPSDAVGEDAQTSYRDVLKLHKQAFLDLDLRMCAAQCDRIIANTNFSVANTIILFEELYNRLIDECKVRVFFAVSAKNTPYLLPEQPLFAEDVHSKFPSVVFEAEEAGRCLGLDRPTAAVFHLMRSMEIGILAVARCLSIPDPTKPGERNWGVMLGQAVKPELDARTKKAAGKSWQNKEDREFFEGAYVSLDAVRAAWRNTTMHVENKYTDEEAEHIFITVRAFMKKLASRMYEAGEPKA